MSMRIGAPNSLTKNALRQASHNRDDEQKSLAKLSSGQRINRAADDAAGLAIAAQMSAELVGLEAGMNNVTAGLAMVETADAGLSATAEQLQRMKELAVAAASNAMSPEQRDAVQAEFDTVNAEIDRIAKTIAFNEKKLLDGSAGEVEISLGQGGDTLHDMVSVDFSASQDAEALGLAEARLDGADGDNARAALDAADAALANVNSQRADLGSAANRLTSAHRNLTVASENTYAARSRSVDADTALETAEAVRQQVLAQAGDAVTVQGRLIPSSVLSLLK